MKKIFTILATALLLAASATTLSAANYKGQSYINLTEQIPLIDVKDDLWNKVPDVAQYGGADWSNAIGRAENISVKEAKEIAESHPEITYFFYLKGGRMVLGDGPELRIFNHGDVIFFTGQPWWGSANGLADGYIKK